MSKFSMYVLSDIHYISHKMWEEGEPINARERGDQIAIKATPEIFDSFCDKIIADKESQAVLITGDLVNNGEKQSHLDFISALDRLRQSGKKVYIITGTHDYAGMGLDENIFKSVFFGKNGVTDAEGVYKTELPELYRSFGPSDADSVHSSSGSYSVSVSDGLRLIGINDNGNGRSHCGLFEDGFIWLENELKKAESKSEIVFIASHHPVIPPWPVYSAIAGSELFGGCERLKELMCSYGVRLIFTGHTHIHGIRRCDRGGGRCFYDIATAALPAARGKMRKAVFDFQTNKCRIESIGIENIKNFDTKGLSAEEYIYSLNFSGLLEKAAACRHSKEFSDYAGAVLGRDMLNKHRRLTAFAFALLDRAKMSLPAALGGRLCALTYEEKLKLKNEYLKTVFFNVLKSVMSGNGPYPPETPEYKAVAGFALRADSVLKKIRPEIYSKLKADSLKDILDPFLYNTRTGDDDSIVIDLK